MQIISYKCDTSVSILKPLPAHQANWAWPKLVHQDPEGQGGGTEQEGPNGEAQIQHLLLVHAAEPLLHLTAGGVPQRHDQGLILCEDKIREERGENMTFGVFGQETIERNGIKGQICRIHFFEDISLFYFK